MFGGSNAVRNRGVQCADIERRPARCERARRPTEVLTRRTLDVPVCHRASPAGARPARASIYPYRGGHRGAITWTDPDGTAPQARPSAGERPTRPAPSSTSCVGTSGSADWPRAAAARDRRRLPGPAGSTVTARGCVRRHGAAAKYTSASTSSRRSAVRPLARLTAADVEAPCRTSSRRDGPNCPAKRGPRPPERRRRLAADGASHSDDAPAWHSVMRYVTGWPGATRRPTPRPPIPPASADHLPDGARRPAPARRHGDDEFGPLSRSPRATGLRLGELARAVVGRRHAVTD